MAEMVLSVAAQSDIITSKETDETTQSQYAGVSLTSLESEFPFQHVVHKLFVLAGISIVY